MKYIYSNAKKIIILIFICICLYLLNKYFNNNNNNFKEGFDSNVKWSRDLIGRFNKYQDSVNMNNNQYNLKVLQEQASPEDAEQLINTGSWSWSENIKNLYLEAVWQNPIIKFDPGHALNYAMKIYNENSVKQLLSWNAKEGQFLLYGGTNTMDKNKNVIKCSDDRSPVLQKTTFNNNSWIGTKNNIANKDIPNEMPGFSFIKDSCNPCSVLNDTPDYSCPFKLNIKGDDETSDIWKTLWQVSG